jgi:hypothetical protein
LSPFQILLDSYGRFETDLQIKRSLQSLIQLLIPDLCLHFPKEITHFLLNSFAECCSWIPYSQIIQVLFQSLDFLCRNLTENHFIEVLPSVFEVLEQYSQMDKLYFFYNRIVFLAHTIAVRGVNLWELQREFFDRMIASLEDIRLQPHGPVIAMLCQLQYRFGVQIMKDIPIQTLLTLLHIGERDGQDCAEILLLFTNLVVDDPSVINRLCPDMLEVLTVLISDQGYRIKEAAMCLCWNIISVGNDGNIRELLQHSEIGEALIDSIEITDEKFIAELAVPTIEVLLRKVDVLDIEWFMSQLFEKISGLFDRSPIFERLVGQDPRNDTTVSDL